VETVRVLRLTVLAAAAALALAAGAPQASRADQVPADADWHEAYIRAGDGTRLHADVFRPKGMDRGDKTPVIVIVSPYIGIGDQEDDVLVRPQILSYYHDLFDRAFRRGYSIVQVSLRGQGASDGCPDHGGPGEQADARAAVRWAATRRWSTGHVGSWGLSWDGYTEVMNLANRTRHLDAAVIMSPVTDAYRDYYMNGVPYVRGAIAAGIYYNLLAAVPPGPPPTFADLMQLVDDAGDPECAPEIKQGLREHTSADPTTRWWRERNLMKSAARSDVPVLFSQGFLDEQVYGDQFLPVWRGLSGPKRAWFGQFQHVVPSEAENGHPEAVGRRGFTAEAFRWLDAYVKGRAHARRAVRRDPPVVVEEGSAGGWRAARRWPPHTIRRSIPLRRGPFFDGPGNEAEPGCTRLELHCVPGAPGVLGTWTLTQELPYDVHVAGVPKLSVNVTTRAPNVHLVALLYDMDAGNRTELVTRGAFLVPRSGTYRFRLYPQDWQFEAGHRIGVFITGSDDDWFIAGHTATGATVTGGGLSMPFLRHRPRRRLPGSPSQAVKQRTWFPFPEPFVGPWSVDARLPPPMR